jgi:hypothetical protein
LKSVVFDDNEIKPFVIKRSVYERIQTTGDRE